VHHKIIMHLIHFNDWFQLALRDVFHCYFSHILMSASLNT